jgi:hypothetical protein
MSKKISFEDAYAHAVTDGIKILGPVVSKIVTDYIESKYSIQLAKTANKPSALDEALEHAIGGGRIIVERRIIRILKEKLGLNEKLTSVESFEKRVQDTKQKFINQARQL